MVNVLMPVMVTANAPRMICAFAIVTGKQLTAANGFVSSVWLTLIHLRLVSVCGHVTVVLFLFLG
jgi:hypothetical protein